MAYLSTPRTINILGYEECRGKSLRVRVEQSSESIKHRYFQDQFVFKAGDAILRFETNLEFPGRGEFDLKRSDESETPYDDDELKSIWISIIPSLLDLDIQTFLLSLSLAFPGGINTIKNVWLVDGRRHHHSSSYVSVINESVDYMVENGFPPEHRIEPDIAVNWVRSQNGIFFGRSDTPASRALNYFTRLFVRTFRNDEISDLVWSVAALEALLVDAGRSSIGQIKSKLEALFKAHERRDWLLQSIEQMYSFRSKMIHGNRQIRSAFRDDEEDDTNRHSEEYDSLRFATGMLIILLQRLVRERTAKYEFELIVKESSCTQA
ncbi:HEPN domain-containing protein [Mesorhizobium sp.]|uniref:HEPN domain-containing protein n=1 Tax=Mesorhizobium sp. TaxID=1871066 RepID=UPI000FE7A1A1|nr:HEPN domain-containing protein [Mesorhizobium sp.]RWD67255.1 MAG: hypothetical protein EOS37_23155 [Mesorhizobium sp.]TIV61074.1 MAG: hypothetical protein E5V80_06340 [Mesorhizobium sp.]